MRKNFALGLVFVFVALAVLMYTLAFNLPKLNSITGMAISDARVSTADAESMLKQAADKYDIPASLLKAVVADSGYNAVTITDCGAAGIAKLMPGTAKLYGLDVFENSRYSKCNIMDYDENKELCFECDAEYAKRLKDALGKVNNLEQAKKLDQRFDPKLSLMTTARILSVLLKEFDNVPELAILGFNIGGAKLKKACCTAGGCVPIIQCLAKIPGHENFDIENPTDDGLYAYIEQVCKIFGGCKDKTFVTSDKVPEAAIDITSDLGIYRFRPASRVDVDYSFDDYFTISEEIKKIITECEKPTVSNLRKCFEDGVTQSNLLSNWPFKTTFDYCEAFDENEDKYLRAGAQFTGKIPLYYNGVMTGSRQCNHLHCGDIDNKKFCLKASAACSNLNCEWYGNQCLNKPDDTKDAAGISEEQCLEMSGMFPYFSHSDKKYLRCRECKDTAINGDCMLAYDDPKYCTIDPCNFGCYPTYVGLLGDDLKFARCTSCPDEVSCGIYHAEDVCRAAPCGGDCVWDYDVCRESSADDASLKYVPERSFNLCVVNQEKRFPSKMVDEMLLTMPVSYKFAVSFAGKLPAPVKGLKVEQFNHTDSKLLISWNKSEDALTDDYYIFAFDTPWTNLESEQPFFGYSESSQISFEQSFNSSMVNFDADEMKHKYDDKVLENGSVIVSENDKRIYVYLDGFRVNSFYKIYVVTVSKDDEFLTKDEYYKDGESIASFRVKDKLAPGRISNLKLVYDESTKNYDMEFNLQDEYMEDGGAGQDSVPENEDGSVLELSDEMILLMYYIPKDALAPDFKKSYGYVPDKLSRNAIQIDTENDVEGNVVKRAKQLNLNDLYVEKPGEGLAAVDEYIIMFVLTDASLDALREDRFYNPQPSTENNYLTWWGELVPEAGHYKLVNLERGTYTSSSP